MEFGLAVHVSGVTVNTINNVIMFVFFFYRKMVVQSIWSMGITVEQAMKAKKLLKLSLETNS